MRLTDYLPYSIKYIGEGTSSQSKMQATAERKEKKQKRKAAEGQLQVKRQEMDKAKVRDFLLRVECFFLHLIDCRCGKALLVLARADGAVQALCGYQSTCLNPLMSVYLICPHRERVIPNMPPWWMLNQNQRAEGVKKQCRYLSATCSL